MPEGLGTRDAGQAERFQIAAAEDQIAGRIPFLARQHFDVDGIEAVEIDPAFVNRLPAFLHDHSAVREPIANQHARGEHEGEQPQGERDEQQRNSLPMQTRRFPPQCCTAGQSAGPAPWPPA